MHKLVFAAVAAVLLTNGPALAGSATWAVTEENVAGVKNGQGSWTVATEGDKITGSASIQSDRGGTLTYTLDGSVGGGVYTLKLNDRSDGKKGCVWTGRNWIRPAWDTPPPRIRGSSTMPYGSAPKLLGFFGYAECDGTKLVIRASIFVDK
jgi:hypothetical protein